MEHVATPEALVVPEQLCAYGEPGAMVIVTGSLAAGLLVDASVMVAEIDADPPSVMAPGLVYARFAESALMIVETVPPLT